MKPGSNPSELPLNSSEKVSSGAIYRFEDYELDCLQWQLRWREENLPITRKSFDLLFYLVKTRPRVVTKDELFEAIWPGQFVEENNLAQQISVLRKTLSKSETGRGMIETVPGRGYRFTPEVEKIPGAKGNHGIVLSAEESVTRITLEEEVQTEDSPEGGVKELAAPPRRKFRTVYIAIAAAAVILLGLGIWFGWRWWQNRQGGPPVQVVLMPLEGSTGDTVLDQALSNAVRSDLAQSPFVTLVSSAKVRTTLQQMRHKADEALTPDSAREVCERTNSQAVVRALLARSGQHFLLTGEAVSCVDGATLASTTREAKRAEELLVSINKLIGSLREKLGESRASIARFSTPVIALDTISLDALKASTAGNKAFSQGKWAEAVELYKQAIALDPDFASAYYNLSAVCINLNDEQSAQGAIRKAYELREYSSPQMQFTISSRYQQLITGDLYQAEKNDIAWTQLYPRDDLPWNQLASVRENLGEWARAAEAARKEVELSPDAAYAQDGVAQDLLYAGDIEGARQHAERALALVPDFESSYVDLARIAVSTGDEALFQRTLDWLSQHPDNPLLLAVEAELAIGRGRFAEGMRWTQQADQAFRRQGAPDAAAETTKLMAMEMIGAGDERDGMTLFRQYPVNAENPTELFSQAVAGEGSKAQASLKVLLTKQPDGTKLRYWFAPLVEGWTALKAGHAQDAVKVLNQPGNLPIYGDIDYARGVALLQAGQPHEAGIAFRSLTDHPYRDQTYLYAVSWVGLARALNAQGDRAGAAKAYVRFFEIWQNADSNAALYQTAKTEAAVLAKSTKR